MALRQNKGFCYLGLLATCEKKKSELHGKTRTQNV